MMDARQDSHDSRSPLIAAAPHTARTGWGRSGRLTFVAVSFALCAIALALVNADAPISSALRQLKIPGDLAKAITLSEVFGHSLGAAAILVSVLLLGSPARRPIVWVAILVTLTSGVASNGMKSLFVRVRPHSVGKIRIADKSFAPDSNQTSKLAVDDGSELVPVSIFDSRQRSFPSGHAATAWGLAIGLSLVFPRGVVLFACFATLASLQRITSGAHFPTDVLVGATIAFVTAACLFPLPPLRKLLVVAETYEYENDKGAKHG